MSTTKAPSASAPPPAYHNLPDEGAELLRTSYMRKVYFANGEYYHIYNRGVDKRNVFIDKKDYWKFFDGLRDFNNKTYYEERLQILGISKDNPKEPSSFDFKELGSFLQKQRKIVNILGYSLNPNHFHFIVQQLEDKGISNFMHKLGTSYPNYFNKKYERSGSLFQGAFKAVHVDNNDYLLWLAGYVNGNIEIHGLGNAENYPWSSYQVIFNELGSLQGKGKERSSLSALSGLGIIFSQFSSAKEFKDFVKQVIRESGENKKMKKYLLEAI